MKSLSPRLKYSSHSYIPCYFDLFEKYYNTDIYSSNKHKGVLEYVDKLNIRFRNFKIIYSFAADGRNSI